MNLPIRAELHLDGMKISIPEIVKQLQSLSLPTEAVEPDGYVKESDIINSESEPFSPFSSKVISVYFSPIKESEQPKENVIYINQHTETGVIYGCFYNKEKAENFCSNSSKIVVRTLQVADAEQVSEWNKYKDEKTAKVGEKKEVDDLTRRLYKCGVDNAKLIGELNNLKLKSEQVSELPKDEDKWISVDYELPKEKTTVTVKATFYPNDGFYLNGVRFYPEKYMLQNHHSTPKA